MVVFFSNLPPRERRENLNATVPGRPRGSKRLPARLHTPGRKSPVLQSVSSVPESNVRFNVGAWSTNLVARVSPLTDCQLSWQFSRLLYAASTQIGFAIFSRISGILGSDIHCGCYGFLPDFGKPRNSKLPQIQFSPWISWEGSFLDP